MTVQFSTSPNVQGAAKNGPLKFFAVFSATVWNFNLKFYRFIDLKKSDISLVVISPGKVYRKLSVSTLNLCSILKLASCC